MKNKNTSSLLFVPVIFFSLFLLIINTTKTAFALDCGSTASPDVFGTSCYCSGSYTGTYPNCTLSSSASTTVSCDTSSGNFTQVGGVCFPNTNLPNPTGGISQVLSNIASWLLGIFSTIAIMAFVISGIQYLTSAGSEEQIETAKKNALPALLGVAVGLSGFVIMQAISAALGGANHLF